MKVKRFFQLILFIVISVFITPVCFAGDDAEPAILLADNRLYFPYFEQRFPPIEYPTDFMAAPFVDESSLFTIGYITNHDEYSAPETFPHDTDYYSYYYGDEKTADKHTKAILEPGTITIMGIILVCLFELKRRLLGG